MNKRFRVCDLNQPFLLPPSLQEWLPEDHLARFVADVRNELDLSAIYREYERRNGRGLSAYHPLLLTRLLVYGYSIGMTSSGAIEKATHDNVAFRHLAADQHPDHDTQRAAFAVALPGLEYHVKSTQDFVLGFHSSCLRHLAVETQKRDQG